MSSLVFCRVYIASFLLAIVMVCNGQSRGGLSSQQFVVLEDGVHLLKMKATDSTAVSYVWLILSQYIIFVVCIPV